MGSSKVLIGGSMSDASANAAPFDVRYAYVHSQPAPSSDYYSASKCQDAWKNWWGCWSGSTTAPGNYVTWWDDHVSKATYQGSPRPQRFFWTWYSLRDLGDLAGQGDGPYLCAIEIRQRESPAALFSCDPQSVGFAPETFAATWCGSQKCAKDYANLGARDADFLVADVSDRDAGWYAQSAHGGYDNFWTDQKATAQMGFYKTMAESVGKPVVLWQIPVGNMAQNNTLNHYKDDKVDWFFAHMDQVANAHIAGLLFGPGQQEQTSVETDGGNLINKTIAYHNSGGAALK